MKSGKRERKVVILASTSACLKLGELTGRELRHHFIYCVQKKRPARVARRPFLVAPGIGGAIKLLRQQLFGAFAATADHHTDDDAKYKECSCQVPGSFLDEVS